MRHQILLVMFLVFGLIGAIRVNDYGDDIFFASIEFNNKTEISLLSFIIGL